LLLVGPSQVQEFLRGPAAQFTLRGFLSIAQARFSANALLGITGRVYYSACTSPTTYSVNAAAGGSGRNAYVNITKTRVWYDSKVVGPKAAYRRELKEVLTLKR
jgi:hypothetical protein